MTASLGSAAMNRTAGVCAHVQPPGRLDGTAIATSRVSPVSAAPNATARDRGARPISTAARPATTTPPATTASFHATARSSTGQRGPSGKA